MMYLHALMIFQKPVYSPALGNHWLCAAKISCTLVLWFQDGQIVWLAMMHGPWRERSKDMQT